MTTDKYELPDYVVSRVRYFDGQFLKDQDFVDEQNYHTDRSNRHLRLLSVSGIAEGLAVTVNADKKGVTVAPGTAIDDKGRLILLSEAQSVALPPNPTAGMTLEISFREVEEKPSDSHSTVSANTRFAQRPLLALSAAQSPGAIHLARVDISTTTKTITALWKNHRYYSGLRLPTPPGARELTLRSRVESDGTGHGTGAELSASLSVGGRLTVLGEGDENWMSAALTVMGPVGIGTYDPKQKLVIDDGKVGIGYNDTAQTAPLAVNGKVGVGTTVPEGSLDVYNGAESQVNVDAGALRLPYGTEKADLILTRHISAEKSTLLSGYPSSLLEFRAKSLTNEWTVAQILGVVDMNKSGFSGGLAFLTGPGGSQNPAGRRTKGEAPLVRMAIDANGNVGIGTTTPKQPLTVAGNVSLGYDEATQSAKLAVNGEVGIGTATPKQKLVVTGGNVGIGYDLSTQTAALAVSGKVGVGTAEPEGSLEIYNGAEAQANSDENAPKFAYGSEKADLVLTRHHSATKSTPLSGFPSSLIEFRARGGTNEWSVAQILGVVNMNKANGYAAGGLAFLTSAGGTVDAAGRRTKGDAPLVRMAIDADGNVGIGTTTPRTALDTGKGVMSGAANDYLKAQLMLTCNGSISWSNNRLKWTNSFLAASMGGSTFVSGTLVINQPTSNIPATHVWDNNPRSVTPEGVLINAGEVLYAVHKVVTGQDTYELRIEHHSHANFHAPSNWIILGYVINDDIKLGTGMTLVNDTKNFWMYQPRVTSDEANLRVVRGLVPTAVGTTVHGSGFSVLFDLPGEFIISFSPAFTAAPTVLCTPWMNSGKPLIAQVTYDANSHSTVRVHIRSTDGALVKNPFSFIAIGPA